VHGDAGGIGQRTLNPKFFKNRKFFLLSGKSGVDGKAASGKPVDVSTAQRTKIAGALKNDELVENTLFVQLMMDTKTGKTTALGLLRCDSGGAEVKQLRAELHRCSVTGVRGVNTDGVFEQPAGKKEFHMEGKIFIFPQSPVFIETDLARPVVVKCRQSGVDRSHCRFVFAFGELLHLVYHVFKSDSHCFAMQPDSEINAERGNKK